jgi:hypothetical protein
MTTCSQNLDGTKLAQSGTKSWSLMFDLFASQIRADTHPMTLVAVAFPPRARRYQTVI